MSLSDRSPFDISARLRSERQTGWTQRYVTRGLGRRYLGVRQLDSGNISPRSLTLNGSTLTWIKDGGSAHGDHVLSRADRSASSPRGRRYALRLYREKRRPRA
jgi:hypothetical protein